MPAPITSPSPTRTVNKSSSLKPRGEVKKKRIVRRRGRALGDIGSDDEIERELATDSESEDELSSLDSASDSDTEPVSEDVIPNGHSPTFTPSSSPGNKGVNGKNAIVAETFFAAPGGNWSEMVNDDNVNGASDLPVIEFADFNGQDKVPTVSRSKKPKKAVKPIRPAVAPTPPPPTQMNGDQSSNEIDETPGAASTSRSPNPPFQKRPPGQTARQAYQQRLEDPSYVPTVGGFWGHDDRLLDKDLRSLSGWWRGRWQGRGRGGYTRGRGRGGFFAGQSNYGDGQPDDQNASEVPPIERAWTHDGFEEMKQREEQRRAARPQQQQQPNQGPTNFRGGRGSFTSGRGGRGGFYRGGYSGRSPAASGRFWYAMKPELMWTKQHEGFLYFEVEPALKPRQGQGQGILVKLPGKQSKVVRAPPRPYLHANDNFNASTWRPVAKSVAGSEHDDRVYTISLPKRSGKEKETAAPASTDDTTIEDAFEVQPSSGEMSPIALKESTPTPETAPEPPSVPSQRVRDTPPHQPDTPVATSSQPRPEDSLLLKIEQAPVESDLARLARTEEAVMKNPSTERVEERPVPAAFPQAEESSSIPVIPTLFSPPLPQPSPVYGSPFGYPPSLPPGIAMNQHGMAYELATGRPVYLQAPPPPMYNPRPMMPSHSHLPPPFVPAHMAHHSAVSPDFLAHPVSHTPPMNGFIDPSTGAPIFSFPRQTSRIEIRAPDGSSAEAKPPAKAQAPPRSSGLRPAASSFEPARTLSSSSDANYFPSLAAPPPAENPLYEGGTVDPAMMAYAHYPQHQHQQPHQQQYYYPEAYGYAHNPYMDMSQLRPYEMYPPPPEGTVYYS
ncbi:hypothetical protein H0H81_005891 [Sphagnurus paluster]|uniref:Btz domain-containing protein n=1 Tax=Sphagnurus paluster TaxID=117069 RepID=A0A9P7G0A8_9AGAR|nr:hypothetical protein H0H81_005891 [Sphagnurus paluster]